MTGGDVEDFVRRERWGQAVREMLAEHPDYAAITVQAMQEGILAAMDRRSERLAEVSMGLYEALRTKPGHVRRDHRRIIRGIEASTLYRTPWSADAIAKEGGAPEPPTEGKEKP